MSKMIDLSRGQKGEANKTKKINRLLQITIYILIENRKTFLRLG